jgi:hypothetical protein
MKAFIYEGELYIRCIPGKNLFRSTMVHEVVNRGDIFAMRVRDQQFTVISGKLEVEHTEVHCVRGERKPVDPPAAFVKPPKDKIAAVKSKLAQVNLPLGDSK